MILPAQTAMTSRLAFPAVMSLWAKASVIGLLRMVARAAI